MNSGSIPPNFANAVSPFNPLGKQTVGEESKETKSSTLKAIVKSANGARTENRRQQSEPELEDALSKQHDQEEADDESGNDDRQREKKSARALIYRRHQNETKQQRVEMLNGASNIGGVINEDV